MNTEVRTYEKIVTIIVLFLSLIEVTAEKSNILLVTSDDWRSMGLDIHTKFADPLFVAQENHNYRKKLVLRARINQASL